MEVGTPRAGFTPRVARGVLSPREFASSIIKWTRLLNNTCSLSLQFGSEADSLTIKPSWRLRPLHEQWALFGSPMALASGGCSQPY